MTKPELSKRCGGKPGEPECLRYYEDPESGEQFYDWCPGCGDCVPASTPEEPGKSESSDDFRMELTSLLNRHGAENGSGTPDHILANYLLGCLGVFDEATAQREAWYGRGDYD